MNSIELLEKLVSFNTIKDKENKGLVDFIDAYLQNLKFKITRTKDINGNECIIANIGEDHMLGFMGHMDTVDISDNWETDPFKLTVKDDKLFGRGTCDMKGGIAATLMAVNSIDETKLRRGIQLVFTTDEEVSFKGVKAINDSKLPLAPYIILCEPTDLNPVIATKGVVSYQLTFKGKTSHSSNPYQGKNAIMDAVDCINEIKKFGEMLKIDKNELFDIDHTTFNVGVINGGTMPNVVPDKCTMTVEFRIINDDHKRITKEKLEELSVKYSFEMKQIVEIGPMIENNELFIKKVESITKKRKGFNYLTEASFLKDSSIIILGPGPITAHESNEYITTKSYFETIEIYKKIIEEYCYN